MVGTGDASAAEAARNVEQELQVELAELRYGRLRLLPHLGLILILSNL